MKINRAALSAALSVLLTLCGGGAMAQQSNFQLSPAPIPYPYFEPGRADYKLTGSYFTISADQLSFRGGGLNVIGRKAFSEAAALDGQIGFLAMNGEMPGFALPFLYSGSVWTPVIDGKGKLLAGPRREALLQRGLHAGNCLLVAPGAPQRVRQLGHGLEVLAAPTAPPGA